MKGRIIDLSLGFNRKQRITLEIDEDFRQSFDELRNADVSVEIKKYRNRRSLDSNAYAWVLIDKIAEKTDPSPAEVYRHAIREIPGVSEILCLQDKAVDKFCQAWESRGLGWQTDTFESKIPGCTNVIAYYGSSTYDTQQMSRLIDTLVEEAKENGIETLPPDKIQSMIEGER